MNRLKMWRTVQIFGNDFNKGKHHVWRHLEYIKFRDSPLPFILELFVFRFAIQKKKMFRLEDTEMKFWFLLLTFRPLMSTIVDVPHR